MNDWTKSFIVACLVLVILFLFGMCIGAIIFCLMGIHPFIIPTLIIVGLLAGITIIVHDKPKPQENK